MFTSLARSSGSKRLIWLVDAAWNLMVIDHSRSFSPDIKLVNEDMPHVDRDLWARMQQLDEPSLTAALDEWLSAKEIRAILERRDLMGDMIDELVEQNGESAVLWRYGAPPASPGR